MKDKSLPNAACLQMLTLQAHAIPHVAGLDAHQALQFQGSLSVWFEF